MTVELLSEPLSEFRALDTSDPVELAQALWTVYGVRHFEAPPAGHFRIRGNFIQLQDIALGFTSGHAPLTVDFPEADFARLQIGLAGQASTRSAGVTTAVDSRQGCITSPGRTARTEFGETYEQLLLRVKNGALERKLSALLGTKPKRTIEFEPAATNDLPQAANLRRMIAFVSSQINSPSAPLPALVLAELQDAITLLLLSTYRHNFSRFLEADSPTAAPKHVRKIEEYIEANWMKPITIETLVDLTGISARGVFKTFQRNRGYSPMAFAKQVRLQHARAMLTQGRTQTTVTAAAFACGFANLGHFAKDYRELFGERPSETLGRSSTSL
ncbi:AraC family transcriptional regulator [Rhodopseudomonas pseudopalustris]|uniref:Transcriptional regulator, AraC family n=2 Tax=Rhodopseudomonas TaxID=1073 RepID=Q13EW4_RHOPS|nr:AraC family transcriptional regulator [Rhodopseudomonas pseudopalustris]ABE37375.1 transcriptional regulator, AraC family [Rhodopseudomonas palustris BisB5]MBB1090194.1 AraC family transcriptional regulator [Rhodopseudomonas palustris]SEO15928.1 transcriptional regulator, AraC family [Rhodopseudomonas pseudopalustris]